MRKRVLLPSVVNIFRVIVGGGKIKVYLCGEKGCWPSVEIREDVVIIGEGDNTCVLNLSEWDELKTKIKNSEL